MMGLGVLCAMHITKEASQGPCKNCWPKSGPAGPGAGLTFPFTLVMPFHEPEVEPDKSDLDGTGFLAWC